MPRLPRPHRSQDHDPVERRHSARDAILAVLLCAAVLVVITGASVRHTADTLPDGPQQQIVAAVAGPASFLAENSGLQGVDRRLKDALSPDGGTSGGGGSSAAVARGAVPAVSADAFDPRRLGQPAPPRRPLKTVLVTGDSMSQPLDDLLAQELAPRGVRVTRDPHIGTGISKSDLVDWTALAQDQSAKKPDAVVAFIGANEGFPLPVAGGGSADCCSAAWAAAYATRARQMMNSWRRAGAARVYWLLLPLPRDPDRQKISRVVNAAVVNAASAYGAQVRILDLSSVFTPRGYRDSMSVGGRDQIVREPDGIHLDRTGSQLAADIVTRNAQGDFSY